MRRRVPALALSAGLAGCSFSPATVSGDALPPDSEPPSIDSPPGKPLRRRQLTIDHTKVPGNQAEFAVWVVLDDPAGLGAGALADGSDIHFTLPDGTTLPFERTAWTKATGHLEAWVKLDLADLTNTVFDVRYGDPPAAHAPDPEEVFSRYEAVFHLDDTLATPVVAEATGTRQGTAVSMSAVDRVPGKLGGGFEFVDADERVTFTNPLAGNDSHTISAWVSVTTPGVGFSSIVTLGEPQQDSARWWHTQFPKVAIGFFGGDFQNTTIDLDDDGFKLVHWVYNGGTKTSSLYVDGRLEISNVHGNDIDTQTAAAEFGNAPNPYGPGGNTPSPLAGILDELRIADAPLDGNRLGVEFANQSSPNTFYAVGPDEPVP